jgi:protein SCO1
MIDKTVNAIPRPQAQSRLSFNQSANFRSSRWILNFALPLVVILSGGAWAHDNTRPAALRDVAFDQKLDRPVPLDLAFRDESGQSVRLADYFKQKPIVLTFVYYKCRDLCPLLLDGVVRSLRALSFDAGKEFDLITVSIDPHDSPALAAAKKKDFVDQYARPGAGAGWHFLTGDETAIQKLTQSVGFHYTYDSHTGEFAHATGMVLLTPNGKTARYYYGIDFSPRDLRLGLIEAAAGKIGSPIDQLLLFCYHYDPVTGKYGLLITRLIRVAGAATVLIMGAFILLMLRRERSDAAGSGRAA